MMKDIASDKSQVRPLPQAVDEIQHHEVQNQSPSNPTSWMAQVLARDNLIRALNQVKRNNGAAGVDRMTVDRLSDYLKQHWPALYIALPNRYFTNMRLPTIAA
ncbi:MAG: hypothetical protein ACK4ML_06640 [Alishewanella aestuarii]